jgi:isovaleryl-CoA dehydrogenase
MQAKIREMLMSYLLKLSEEDLNLFQKNVHEFAQQVIAPLASEIDRTNIFPIALWPKLGEMGLLGVTVEARYGGSDLGYRVHAMIMEEISRASGSVGLSYIAHSNLCMNQIQRYGTEEQKQKYLPPLCSGEHIGALAMSEAGAGSDVVSMALIAKPVDAGFILNGHKMWITNGPQADTVIVYAKTDVLAKKQGLSAFIIEKGTPGFSSSHKIEKMGMRGSDTSELYFKDVFLPASALLGNLHEGVRVLMSGLDYERLLLAAGPVGIMQACLDAVLPYVSTRSQFGAPIGSFQLVQAKIADMYTALQSSRAYLYQLARSADEGTLKREDAAALFLLTAENATKVALDAMQLFGGNGYSEEYPLSRYVRDAKLYEIGGGTTEIRRTLIARELLKNFSE